MGWLKKEIVDINRSRHELFDGWHAYLTLTAVVFFAFGLASCADTATTQIPVKDVTASRTIDEMVPPRVLDGIRQLIGVQAAIRRSGYNLT
jgi:hypothetical protein